MHDLVLLQIENENVKCVQTKQTIGSITVLNTHTHFWHLITTKFIGTKAVHTLAGRITYSKYGYTHSAQLLTWLCSCLFLSLSLLNERKTRNYVRFLIFVFICGFAQCSYNLWCLFDEIWIEFDGLKEWSILWIC